MPIADPRLIKTPGRYWDENGLYLEVARRSDDRLSKTWLVRYSAPSGSRRDMSLGAYPEIGLAEARRLTLDARAQLRAGVDPLNERRAKRAAAQQAAATSMTFKTAAGEYLISNEAGWHNEKHRAQWRTTLETYAYPVIGNLACAEITSAHVIDVLKPIWTTKRETARRVRGRIETVLNFAGAKGARDPSQKNPAEWKGTIEFAFPKRSIIPVRHHPAMPYRDVPSFMAELAARTDISARCLEITILTAMRTSESIAARGIETDLEAEDAIWTVPGRRMKMKKG